MQTPQYPQQRRDSTRDREQREEKDNGLDPTDLELGEKELDSPTVQLESIILGLRKSRTSNGHAFRMGSSGTAALAFGALAADYDDDSDDASGSSSPSDRDTLTKLGNLLDRIHGFSIVTRYALYILPVATLLAIPLILTDTIYRTARAGNIRLLGLFIWIEVIWVALWLCKLVALALPIVVQALCGLISTGIRKYALVLMALEVPLSLLFWAIVAFASTPLICVFDRGKCASEAWVGTVRTVFKAGIVVAAIFLVEKAIVQMVSIEYHRKQYAAKIAASKQEIRNLAMLYNASRRLFPEFGREFKKEDADIHGNGALADVRSSLAKVGVPTKMVSDIGRVRQKMTAAFGAMASDISGKRVLNTNSGRSIVVGVLESERGSRALARRLWLSFAAEGNQALYKEDLLEVLGPDRKTEAEDIFAALDRDENGDVSLDEMTMLVMRISQERKNRMSSMHDISQAIAVLDRLLSLVVLAAIALIYAAFFSKTFATKSAQLWTSIAGLAFASGGVVTEFFSCCIFIFVKHPYDVGDRVDIKEIELVVEHISLTYSVFRRIDSDKTVQIPHSMAATMWIENVSRSRNMKERLSINVSSETQTDEILKLRSELEAFIAREENRRDFQPEVDIELRSVGDMKHLELRVEIRHKSNFANEQLRNARRNRFMCELLSAIRRIPIEPPGGTTPPLGDAMNPSWTVTIPPDEGVVAREKKIVDVASSGAFRPAETTRGVLSGEIDGSQISSIRTAQTMISGIPSGRRGSTGGSSTGKRATDTDLSRERLRRFNMNQKTSSSLRETFAEHSD